MARAWLCLAAFHACLLPPASGDAAKKEGVGPPLSLVSFASFTEKYGRVYHGGLAEYQERKTLFEGRAAKVLAQNSLHKRRWSAGINEFSDRRAVELARHRGWRRRGSPKELARHGGSASGAVANHGRRHQSGAEEAGLSLRQLERATSRPAPSKMVSWAFLNSTKRHFNQGSCGSCWAIASAVLLEAHSEIHAADGKGRTFSAQELVSCVPNPKHCGGTGGCEGATIELAMEWTIHHGLSDDETAPYKGIDGECLAGKQEGLSLLQILDRKAPRVAPREEHVGDNEHETSLMPGTQFGMLGWERLPENDYSAMLHALQEGPVGISVAASDWFEYSHGVFDKCIKDSVIDHAVVLLGYGQNSEDAAGDGYWLLKNSWGLEWGEHGVMRLLRRNGEVDEGGWCGVDRQPELGSGCIGGPTEVKVCGTCGILYDAVVPHWQGSAEHAKQRARATETY